TLEGNEGTNSAWVITNETGEILGLPESNVIDLEGAGAGVCLIWHLSYEDGLTGAEVGMNASDLDGCFALSNPITVVRTGVSGGTISTEDATAICPGDGIADPINVTLEGNEGTNSAWVITDEAGVILGLPEGPVFDLDEAGVGVCLIWHLSFEDGLVGAEVDLNANDLEGCFSLSNPITVVRSTPEAAVISTEDALEICAGDGVEDPITVAVEGGDAANTAWVITDEAGEILGLPESNVIDLEGAGEGVCLIWHLSYNNVEGVEVGMNANDLTGCFALSNSISVTRTGVAGGTITTEDPTTICVDGVADPINVTLEGNEGTNSAWVITDEAGEILALPEGSPFDLDGAGPGVCLLWHLSFEDGLTGAEVGMNAADLDGCFSLSNSITVTRAEPVAGTISTTDATEICAGDGVADAITVDVDGAVGPNFAWVITDEAGEILGLPETNVIDLEGAGEGVCLIWYVSFGTLEGAEVGMNANDLTGCFALSNSITVTRTGVDAGTVTTDADETTVTVIVGDGDADVIAFANTSESDASYVYVITDDSNVIIGSTTDSNDFEGAEAGTCLVWGVSYTGEITITEGESLDDLVSDGCSVITEEPVTVIREAFNSVLESDQSSTYLFPSAGNGAVTLVTSLNNPQIEVYSNFGQLVMQNRLNSSTSTLDFSNLASGNYKLEIETVNFSG
ncbi:MAG: T9SS type A sorting domain-containing protein, partial [Flavobacteriales bacterium]